MITSRPHNILVQGLFERSPEKVAKALQTGVDVNAPFSKDDPEPIWFSGVDLLDFDVEHRPKLNQIWSMIIPRAAASTPDVAPAADRVLKLRNPEAAALVVLYSIQHAHERNTEFLPSLPKIFPELQSKPETTLHVKQQQRIEAIFANVAEKIASPKSDFERMVAGSLTQRERDYWTAPPVFNLCPLPLPRPRNTIQGEPTT